MAVSPQGLPEDLGDFSSDANISLDSELTQFEPSALYEIEEDRGAFSKFFMQDDRSKLAVVMQTPMHYQDDQGDWQDIDNTLVNTKDSLGNEILENKAGDVTLQLPKVLTADETVNVMKDDYQVSFKIKDVVQDSDGLVEETSSDEDLYEIDVVAQSLETISEKSTVTYEEIADNTDVKFDVLPGTVKESIIINDKSAIQTLYAYEIIAQGLTAELLEDNSIKFYAADGTVIFTMPTPYMLDSAEEPGFSSDIQIEFEDLGNGEYALSYIPDEDWINSSERVYPIIIDPTISTQPNWQGGFQNSPWYDVPTLPAGSVIQSARYKVQYYETLYYFEAFL